MADRALGRIGLIFTDNLPALGSAILALDGDGAAETHATIGFDLDQQG